MMVFVEWISPTRVILSCKNKDILNDILDYSASYNELPEDFPA